VALDSAAAADVLLAVGEAVSNAVEHATRDASHAVDVVVSAKATRSGVALTVADNGRWRTPRRLPGNRGHGRKLMSALVDTITITPSPQGTTVEMHKELAS
jgi:anti-sigma regulatory factor (Ser/Thr protein kinase)